MKLEEAIKQAKPFACPYEKGVVNLMYTNGWLRSKMKTHFAKLDVTEKQYNILRILKGAGTPVSNTFIRARLLDQLSDVSRIIDRMYKKNLVQKTTSKKDKRLVDVSLTQAGLKILKSAENKKESIHAMLSNLTKTEVLQLNTLLDKIRLNNS